MSEPLVLGFETSCDETGVGLVRGQTLLSDALHATVFLEVRTDNDAARTLYETEGFAVVGLRRNYYRPSGADAYTMRREAR